MERETEHHEPQTSLEDLEAAEIQALLPHAARFFGLGDIKEVKSTPFGIGNESFFVSTSQGEFVMRVLWTQTREGLEKEVAIETQLLAADILTVQLIRGENGNYYFTDEKYTITSSKKIEGSHPLQVTPELLNTIGTTMAKFHLAVREIPNNSPQWFNLENATQEVNQVTDEHTHENIQQNFRIGKSLFEHNLPTGFIHGDLYAGNLLVTPDKELAILDFETAERNPFIIDIARTILDMCTDGTRIDQAKVDDLLVGYEKIRELTTKEKENLSQAILYVSGAMSAWLLVERNQFEVAQEILARANSR